MRIFLHYKSSSHFWWQKMTFLNKWTQEIYLGIIMKYSPYLNKCPCSYKCPLSLFQRKCFIDLLTSMFFISYTKGTITFPICFLGAHSSSNVVYSSRKEFALRSKFFPLRADPFCKVRQKRRNASSKSTSIHLNIVCYKCFCSGWFTTL